MFVDIVNKKLEELQQELDNSKDDVSVELIEQLNDFISTVGANQQDLDEFDVEFVADSVYESDEEKLKAVKNRLKVLSGMASDRRESGLSFFDFDENQKAEILKFCEDAKVLVDSLEKRLNTETEKEKVLKDNLSNYHAMMSRIDKHEKLAATDFDVILDMISSMSLKERKNILLDFISYNADANDVKEEKQEEVLDLDSEFKEIDSLLARDRKRYTSRKSSVEDSEDYEIDLHVNIEDVLNAINKYESSEDRKGKIDKAVNRHKVELSKVFDIDNASGIINFLKEKKMYEKFGFDEILTVLSYGTEESVRNAYDRLSNYSPSLINEEFVLKLPSLWVEPKKRKNKGRSAGKSGDPTPNTGQTLRIYATKVYLDELFEKIDFFNNIGINIVKDKKRVTKSLSSSLEELKKRLYILQQYNLDYADTPSLFVVSEKSIAEKADAFVECGMLKPDYNESEGDSIKNGYANINSARALVSYHTGHLILLQDLFINETKGDLDDLPFVRDDIFSEKRDDTIKTEFYESYMGYDLKKAKGNAEKAIHQIRLDNFALAHDLVITNESNMPKYDLMEKSIIYGIDISAYTLESDFIRMLDALYLVPARKGTEPYLYNIDGNMISRYKVLRIYQSLLKHNLVSEKQFNEDDMRFFAVSYGTYLKSEDYQNLKEIVKRGERRL